MTSPLVTVVLSVLNGDAYVGEAIRSVITQTFESFEFLIIDDGSTDKTIEKIQSFSDPRIHLMAQQNQGLARSLNRGLRRARGRYVARIDADDTWLPSKLQEQVAFLVANPEVALVGSWAQVVDGSGRRVRISKQPSADLGIKWALLFHGAFIHSSVTFRKSDVVFLGGYPEEFYKQDHALWLRLASRHRLANLPMCLVTRKLRPDSLSRTHEHARMQEGDRLSVLSIRRALGSCDFSEDELIMARRFVYHRRPDSIPRQDISTAASVFSMLMASFVNKYQRDLKRDSLALQEIRSHASSIFLWWATHMRPNNLVMASSFAARAIRIRPSIILSRYFGRLLYPKRAQAKE